MTLKNLDTPEKVMTFINRIEYGWMGIDGNIRKNTIKGFQKFYRTQSIEEIIETRNGICIDDVELERFFLSNYYQTQSYAIITSQMFHAFLILEKDGIFTYFEYSSCSNKGIYHFLTEQEALEFVVKSFIKRHKIKSKRISLVAYPPIPPNTTFLELKEILTSCPNLLEPNNKGKKEY